MNSILKTAATMQQPRSNAVAVTYITCRVQVAVMGGAQRNYLGIQDKHVLLSWRKINLHLFTCKLKALDMEIREKQEIVVTVTSQSRIVLCFLISISSSPAYLACLKCTKNTCIRRNSVSISPFAPDYFFSCLQYSNHSLEERHFGKQK